MKSLDYVEGGDPQTTVLLKRAVKRMSYDYQREEKRLAKVHQTLNKIESNINNFKIGDVIPAKPLGDSVKKLNEEDRDY